MIDFDEYFIVTEDVYLNVFFISYVNVQERKDPHQKRDDSEKAVKIVMMMTKVRFECIAIRMLFFSLTFVNQTFKQDYITEQWNDSLLFKILI